MPDKPQSGMTEDQAITALRARPDDARKALLARMDPATKQRVLAKLQAPQMDPAIAKVGQQFPAYSKYLANVVVAPGKNNAKDDRQVEFYPPWESENPNPGKLTVQPYRHELTSGEGLTNTVSGELLHYIGGVNPSTGKPVDPDYYRLKQGVKSARTPSQVALDQREYQAAQQRGEKRPFDQWFDNSRLDEYIMGYVTPDKTDEWRKNGFYKDPNMARAVEATKRYLTSPRLANPKDLSALDPNFQGEKTAEKHANAVDYILDQLPTAVGTGASMLGGSKKLPMGMAAAAAGGVLGEDARELLGKHLYNDPARKADVSNMTAKDAVEKLATAGAEQSGAELVGRGVSGTVSKIAEKLGLTGAAKSAAAAAAGNGVQKTPGEVSGNRAQQFLEHFLSYMPGAMGPMGHFEEMRAGQTAEMVTKQLDQISSQNLTREQTGEAVSKVIKDMKGSAAQESNLAYNPLKKPLGLPEDATRAQIEEAARKAASPHAGSVLDASGKPVMVPGDGGAAMRSLRAADAAHGAAQDKIEANLVTKIANTNRVEAVHRYVADASIADLRAILPKLAPETRQAVARNVMEDAFNAGRDPVSGEFNAKAALKALSSLDKDGPKSALLFGKNAATVREALKEIASIQHGHSPGGGMAGHRVMSTIILALPQAALGVLTGHVPETLALVGGEMGAARMLSGLITNPETSLKVLTALRRMAAGTIRVGGPAVTDLIRQESLPPPASQAMTASPTAQFMSQH